MRTYPQLTMRTILYELPSSQSFALLAGAHATDPMCDAEPVHGYIAQEVKRRQAAIFRRLASTL